MIRAVLMRIFGGRGNYHILWVEQVYRLALDKLLCWRTIMRRQVDTMGKRPDMSHNVYSDKSVANRNILNHIINSTYQTRLTDLTEQRYSIKQIFVFLAELITVMILFGGFAFLISLSDSFDQHLMEWMGR